MTKVTVRALATSDFDAWRPLYRAYAEFYEQTDDMASTTWEWLTDPEHEVSGLVAELGDELVGLAHYRPFARPLSATTGGYLDDLFVSPAARGTGAADALLARLREIGADRGWSVIRWVTAHDNLRARAKYDQVASRTMWVTYDMPVEL